MNTMTRRSGRTRGQALLEFALVLPIFLALLFMIVDFGRVVWATGSLSNAAREGARYAIVHGGTASNPCPVGPSIPGITTVPAASASCPHPSPSKQSITDAVQTYMIAGGTNVSVSVCYGSGCSGNTDAAGATNARGVPVTVTVTSNVDLVTGQFIGLGSFSISGTSTMVVNY
jgi:Flp pilus assembly protein TadG